MKNQWYKFCLALFVITSCQNSKKSEPIANNSVKETWVYVSSEHRLYKLVSIDGAVDVVSFNSTILVDNGPCAAAGLCSCPEEMMTTMGVKVTCPPEENKMPPCDCADLIKPDGSVESRKVAKCECYEEGSGGDGGGDGGSDGDFSIPSTIIWL